MYSVDQVPNINKLTLWKNFAAAIDMLKSIIQACPDSTWESEKQIYYLSYHTVIFLDFYLTNPVQDFKPYLQYTLGDPRNLPAHAIDDVLPKKPYSKNEMLVYLDKIRAKSEMLICHSEEELFSKRWISDSEVNIHGLCPPVVIHYSWLEILFYNLRHIQHHVGQLNLLLRQKADLAVDWISHAD